MATSQKLNDEYSEKCLIAILLTNSELVDMISGTVDKEYFYNLTHRHIYERICSLRKNEKPINFVTIAEEEKSINEQTKLSTYCAGLSSLVSGSSEWESYVNSLADCYAERLSRNMANSFLDDNSSTTINERVDKLINDLSKVSVRKNNGYSMKQLAYDNAAQVESASKAHVLFTGFESGFENLDTIIDGWQEGTMYVIGARPSIGKTAFALSILTGLARKGTKCSMFSLEMSASSLYYRMVSAMSGIPMWQIRKGIIGNVSKYLHAGSILSELPISVFDSDIDNDKKLYARIRYEARIKGSKVIMIDHLGLIEVSDSSGQRYVDVGRITKTLHKMAKELKVCIVVLAQCGREAEGKKPNLALLRESGNIEQDGDVIMLLHRKREITDTEEKDPLAELPTDVIIAKNRDGRTGTATFAFQPTTMRFREDVGRSALDDLGERNESVKKKEYKDEIPF